MNRFLEKLQYVLFSIGSHFKNITVFECAGNKIQDYRTWYYNL